MKRILINVMFNKLQRALIKEALHDSYYAKKNAINETLQEDASTLLEIRKHFKTSFNLYQ